MKVLLHSQFFDSLNKLDRIVIDSLPCAKESCRATPGASPTDPYLYLYLSSLKSWSHSPPTSQSTHILGQGCDAWGLSPILLFVSIYIISIYIYNTVYPAQLLSNKQSERVTVSPLQYDKLGKHYTRRLRSQGRYTLQV